MIDGVQHRIPFAAVPIEKKNYEHDHIRFNLQGNGILFLFVSDKGHPQTQLQHGSCLTFFHISFLSFTLPVAPYRIFLQFSAQLPYHFYLVVIEQQQHEDQSCCCCCFNWKYLPLLYEKLTLLGITWPN